MKRRIFSGMLVVSVIFCCLSACNKRALTFINGSVTEKTRFSSDVVYDSDSAGRTKGGNFSFVNITAETGVISGDAYTIGDLRNNMGRFRKSDLCRIIRCRQRGNICNSA